MGLQQITYIITKDGKVNIETEGFEGNSCKEATKSVEERLGITEDVKEKPEYFNSTTKSSYGQQIHNKY